MWRCIFVLRHLDGNGSNGGCVMGIKLCKAAGYKTKVPFLRIVHEYKQRLGSFFYTIVQCTYKEVARKVNV